ncbi:uncharacterized protein LOC128990804 isoform X2 [Macrosteles quadrilineatus]|uniref:uncharacterized protein LOC128990804 isoform X2 n=1 Tax=Macrosteles quadrilineatus TaxID=74068 RepID=UPI0023E311E1|nr:uncharacterized protein LOC128990804 isoform X2 [Macrosteles quadrilineatus]
MNVGSATLLVLGLLSAVSLGDGIRCYVCNSKQDARCLDPFVGNSTSSAPMDTVDCEYDNTVRAALETVANLMTKLGQAPARDPTDVLAQAPSVEAPQDGPIPASCQKIDLIVLGERVTGRGCSVHQLESFNPCDAVKLVTTADVTLEFCGVCDYDGCNSRPLLASGALLPAAAVGLYWSLV